MAIPTADTLKAIVKVTADTPEQFIAKLSTQMSDATTVKNGYRVGGSFSFYVPGAMWGAGVDEVRKQLKVAGYDVLALQQIQGYMPTNEMVDFRAAGPDTPGVTGPTTFPWIHVQIRPAVQEG